MNTNLFINATGHYLPGELIPNDYFLDINGLSDEWIFSRTGIKTRTKASKSENTNTMSVDAMKCMIEKYGCDVSDVDLIVGATYTPWDTVATIAHQIQKEFNIENSRAISITSACSSFLSATEIVETYFAAGKASKAIVVVAEHNTAYSNEACDKSGHLWGDGAACMLVSKEKTHEQNPQIIDIHTQGLAHIGKGPDAVFLQPANGGLQMPFGKDVFINACKYMAEELVDILANNGYTTDDVDYVIPHQANIRIIDNIAKSLKLPKEKILTRIKEHGNTGSASTLIGLSLQSELIEKDSLMAFTVFGGGYSSGSMLLKF